MSTLVAYRTAPNAEHKAAAELRQAGVKAYVPRDRNGRRSPFTGKMPAPAPGYVFAAKHYRPAFDKHVRSRVGTVREIEIARLYLACQRRRSEERCPYVVGQPVFNGEVPATVREIRGRTCIIDFLMLGKPHSQAIPYAQLRPG